MLKNKVIYPLITATMLIVSTLPANAIGITFSEKTGKPSTIINLRGGTNLPLNFSANAGLEFMPSYSDIVGKSSENERWSTMANVDATLQYNWTLIDAKTLLGNFNPTFSPYLGYKHFFSHTGTGGLALDQLQPTTSFLNTGGVKYGLRFSTDIPLGFNLYADAGAINLLNTNPVEDKVGSIATSVRGNNLMLPHAGAGISWSLLNIVTLRAGYNFISVPDIRNTSSPLDLNNRTAVQSIDIGASFLFFSI
jgi:opacity protein-like surface antigen